MENKALVKALKARPGAEVPFSEAFEEYVDRVWRKACEVAALRPVPLVLVNIRPARSECVCFLVCICRQRAFSRLRESEISVDRARDLLKAPSFSSRDVARALRKRADALGLYNKKIVRWGPAVGFVAYDAERVTDGEYRAERCKFL